MVGHDFGLICGSQTFIAFTFNVGDWLEFHIRVPTRKGIKSKPEATRIRVLDPENLAINRKPVINASKREVEASAEHQEPSEDASKPAEHNPINIPTVKLTFDSGIVSLLKSFDEAERDRQFSKATFECLVCFSEKFGSQCLRFVREFLLLSVCLNVQILDLLFFLTVNSTFQSVNMSIVKRV